MLPRMSRRVVVFVLITVAFSSTYARAWGTKEHIQLTRIAIERLMADPSGSPEMRRWLRMAAPGLMGIPSEKEWFLTQRQGIVPRGVDGICYWCVMPDVSIIMAA